MAEDLIFNVKVKTDQASPSIKGVRAELRALTQELATLEPGSQAFVTAAKRAGELKERMADAQATIKAFNPEAKFAAFAGVLGGVANGFSAVQGAMALFGSENKNLQEVMLKTQGAMAFATGINGLLGLKDAFSNLKLQVLDGVKSLFTLRGALIATGIGAIAVLVGTLVANWKEFTKAIEKTFPAFKVISDFFGNLKQIAAGAIDSILVGFKGLGDVFSKFFSGDFSGAYQSASKIGSNMAIAYNKGYDKKDKEIKLAASNEKRKFELDLLEAQGKDVLNARLKLQKDELKLLEKGSEEYNKKLIEIANTQRQIKERDDKANEKKEKDKLDAFKKREEERRKASQDLAEEQKTISDWEDQNIREGNERIKKEDEDLAKAKIDTNEKTFNAIANGIQSIGDLAGANAEEGKALGVASSIIDTYTGATKAYAQGGVLGFVSAAAIILAGLSNVQKILSVQIPNSKGSSPMPSINASVPSIPTASNSTMLTGANSPILTRSINMKDQKVYVTETDIRNATNRVNEINRKVTIK